MALALCIEGLYDKYHTIPMSKIRILFLGFLMFFALIAAKLLYIQVLQPDHYSADYTQTQKIIPKRGRILDRNGEPLAINQTKYQLYAEPEYIEKKFQVIDLLEKELRIGEATLEARLDMNKDWVSLQNGLTKEQRLAIEKLEIKGLGFREQEDRYYPEASLAAHLIGFLGKDDTGGSIGYFGVEGYYDKDLAGLPGVLKSERDLFGRTIFIGNQERIEADNGRDIVLTIDKSVQHIIKEQLKIAIEQFKAKSACALAVKPQTMEVLGMACLPDFDPAKYYDFAEEDFINWMISSTYEPGSTFKPLVVAAGLEEGVIKPNDIFNESGPTKIGEYTIRNWNDEYEGKITISNVLEKSSNVGMVHIGEKLGKEKLFNYVQLYGFGEYTNIDLQGETTGQVKPFSGWYPIDAATMAFGQGVSVTGIQLVRAFASVINGGNLMRPYVVQEVIENGISKKREPQVQRRIVSEKTSAQMRKMLVSTVNHAEATWDIPEGFTFGGKTGTAQIAVRGTYDASKTIASFIGFAPAEDPAFLMLVVVQEPESSEWGSETAAPLFFDIAEELLIYYNVSPS